MGLDFYSYAGNKYYISYYVLPGTEAYSRWMPTPIGILRQGGKLGLVLASPLLEAEFLSKENGENFERLLHRLTLIARIVGVESINLSGILPSVLMREGKDISSSDPRRATTSAIAEAVGQVTANYFDGARVPVVVLGGAGFIGSHLVDRLRSQGSEVHVVDSRIGVESLPQRCAGKPCLVIDIARRGVIRRYVNQFWSEIVLINETFPIPPKSVLAQLAEKGVRMFHIAGVDGKVVPDFPFGYENAVPCCAAHVAEESIGVRLLELTPGFSS